MLIYPIRKIAKKAEKFKNSNCAPFIPCFARLLCFASETLFRFGLAAPSILGRNWTNQMTAFYLLLLIL